MIFFKIINKQKLLMFSFFIIIFLFSNMFYGERGLISYFKNLKTKDQLVAEKTYIENELNIVEKKNNLLRVDLDLDYLEILYRKMFVVGKKDEKIFTYNYFK